MKIQNQQGSNWRLGSAVVKIQNQFLIFIPSQNSWINTTIPPFLRFTRRFSGYRYL